MGYDRWAAKYNLKQMAATVTAYQQYGFSSPEELDEARIADFRAKIADRKASSGKEYLSFYFMEANSYEVE